MFAPINDDRVFVIFTGVVGALLLLAIALLGHLLGFHIYLSKYNNVFSSFFLASDKCCGGVKLWGIQLDRFNWAFFIIFALSAVCLVGSFIVTSSLVYCCC